MKKAVSWAQRALSKLKRDESGAALIEYALLVGLVAVLCIAALGLLQTRIAAAYGAIGTHLTTIQ